MVRERRPRHFVSGLTLRLLVLPFRYSSPRNAYVLRVIGNTHGPVLCRERRRQHRQWPGEERRQLIIG
jgi:hypothetical protein